MKAEDRHLIALDIDGTVMPFGTRDESGQYVPATPDAAVADGIRSLFHAGHEVVLSTGRSVDATLDVVEQLRIQPTWVVACNGAVTLKRDPLATRAYRRQSVEAFDPTELLLRIRSHLMSAMYGIETATGEFLYTEPIPSGTLPRRQRKVTFDELLGVQTSRVLVVSPDHALQDFLEISETLGLTRVSYAVGLTTWFDIAPAGVTKASALEVIRAREGIDRANVFAAGDGENDIQMLQWAGRMGDSVAMGQAEASVIAVAGRTTGTVFEDGLLTALQERFSAHFSE
ncbi:MAG: HAD family phosphatase [Leucobacter sp.]|jgi:hydroxymethylpyrimidine pyrophosphatase-like HAD family hydrolase|nr:HAD family phosphatase [Leucobacter sp.]